MNFRKNREEIQRLLTNNNTFWIMCKMQNKYKMFQKLMPLKYNGSVLE